MATDATGAPTSPDNIPTYNTAVDAPSGAGFNAAMASIQTALSSRVTAPVGLVSGETPIWNGAAWVRSSVTGLTPSGIAGYPADQLKVLRGDGSWNYDHSYLASVLRTTALAGAAGVSFAAGTNIFGTSVPWTADGTSSYIVDFFCPNIVNSSAAANTVIGISLDNGTTFHSILAQTMAPAAAGGEPVFGRTVFTPAAGAMTIVARAWVGGGSATLNFGTGTGGTFAQGFLGIKRL